MQKQKTEIPKKTYFYGEKTTFAMHPDNQCAALLYLPIQAIGNYAKIALFDLQTKNQLNEYTIYRGQKIKWHPIESLLAVGSNCNYLIDVKKNIEIPIGQTILNVDDYCPEIAHPKWHPSGKKIVLFRHRFLPEYRYGSKMRDEFSVATIYDIQKNEPQKIYGDHFAWHPQEKIVAFAEKNTLIVHNLESNHKERLPLNDQITKIKWHPKKPYIAIAFKNNSIAILDTRELRRFKTFDLSDASIWNIRWHPKRTILFADTFAKGLKMMNIESDLRTDLPPVFLKKILFHVHNEALIFLQKKERNKNYLVTYDIENKKEINQEEFEQLAQKTDGSFHNIAITDNQIQISLLLP